MSPMLYLFDIDGTLLSSDGAGRTAMEAALQAQAYQQACAALPHPVVAFCRSGARATALYQACGCQVGCAS